MAEQNSPFPGRRAGIMVGPDGRYYAILELEQLVRSFAEAGRLITMFRQNGLDLTAQFHHLRATAEALDHESSLFGLLASTDDMQEGMEAFLEKRKPDFKGR